MSEDEMMIQAIALSLASTQDSASVNIYYCFENVLHYLLEGF